VLRPSETLAFLGAIFHNLACTTGFSGFFATDKTIVNRLRLWLRSLFSNLWLDILLLIFLCLLMVRFRGF
jgi:hypothetical protein